MKNNKARTPTLFKHIQTGHYYTISDGPLGKRTGYVKVARPYGTGGETLVLDGKNGRTFDKFIPIAKIQHNITNNRCLIASHSA